MTDLSILYRDEYYVAIYKPAGLLVHRTRLARDREAVVQMLRAQLGQRVYPIHRLDRATSGVLLFGLHGEAAQPLAQAFEAREVGKRYLAVVRGYCPTEGHVDYALSDSETGRVDQEAITRFERLATVELPIPVARYQTARYSLVAAEPITGRRHQLRKHFAHLRHPIVGDTTHGVGEQNRLFRRHFDCHRLLLFAQRLTFTHPFTGRAVDIVCQPDAQLSTLFERLGFDRVLPPLMATPNLNAL